VFATPCTQQRTLIRIKKCSQTTKVTFAFHEPVSVEAFTFTSSMKICPHRRCFNLLSHKNVQIKRLVVGIIAHIGKGEGMMRVRNAADHDDEGEVCAYVCDDEGQDWGGS